MSNINIKICEVISVEDKLDSGRIKVRLFPEDRNKEINDIPYAYPLLPKIITIPPKIGEAVIVLLAASGEGYSNRFYIGPIISQITKLEYDGFHSGALSNYDDSLISSQVSHNLIQDAQGAFGGNNDIAFYSRKGSDIILKEDDVRIRAGARINSDNKIGKTFNKFNPSYLKLKYSDKPTTIINKVTGDEQTYNSTATLVADQINLIANNSTNYFTTTDNDELITDEEMKNIIENAHVLPYGDILVEFLKKFLKMFKEHAHPYPGMPTILPSGNEGFFNYNLDKILSKNVRIN